MINHSLETSPCLGYKLGPPAQLYYMVLSVLDAHINLLPRELLIWDIMWHIKKHRDIKSLDDVFDSVMFFTGLLLFEKDDEVDYIPSEPDKNNYIVKTEDTADPEDGDLIIKKVEERETEELYGDGTLMYGNSREGDRFADICSIKSMDDRIFRSLKEPYRVTSKYDINNINLSKWQEQAFPFDFDATSLDRNKILSYPNISTVINKLSETESDCHEIKTALAALYILVDEEEKAIETYKNMKTMDAYDHYNLGTIYLIRKHNLDMAREQYEKALQLENLEDPEEELEEVRYNLAMTFFYNKEWRKAAEIFRRYTVSRNIDEVAGLAGFMCLDHFIRQFSYNNLGICNYKMHHESMGDLKKILMESLDLFQKAALWLIVTNFSYGTFNAHQMTALLKDITSETGSKRKSINKKYYEGFSNIIGSSDAMQEIYTMIRQAARSDSNVLITGETGTGKELVARAIHDDGIRKDKPFISLNSSAIPKELIESELFGHEKGAFTGANSRKKGIFESADKGTLFLDEIGEMSLDAQAKLLRVIEYGDFMRVGGSEYIKVDTRIIAATNRDLEKACKEGRFREDLYYRINVFHIKLPPLRDRREDIPLLINYFIEKTSKSMDRRFTLTEPANELLNCYSWPGNIRQLQNAIEVAISRAEGEIIHSWDLPEEILKTSESNEDTERKMIIEAYRASNGNATEAANMLGMPRSTFYNKAREQYGIDLNSIKNELKKHS